MGEQPQRQRNLWQTRASSGYSEARLVNLKSLRSKQAEKAPEINHMFFCFAQGLWKTESSRQAC